MAFGRGSMTKEMVGGTKAKATKKMAMGGPVPGGPRAVMPPRPGGPGNLGGPRAVMPPRPGGPGVSRPMGTNAVIGASGLPPPPPGGVFGGLRAPDGVSVPVRNMKKGGKVKMNSGGAAGLGDAMKQKVDAMGTRMSKGGKVGGRGDGIAIKGKTKGCSC